MKELEPLIKTTWNYLGWKDRNPYLELGEHEVQLAWNNTLLTIINKVSHTISSESNSVKRSKHTAIERDVISLSEHCLNIIKDNEYYCHNSNKFLGKDIVVNEDLGENTIIISSEGSFHKKLFGEISIENLPKKEKSISENKSKVAFILGITGQDGSYLAELLLEKGYNVHAIMRRASTFNTERIEHIMKHERVHIHHGDITDSSNIMRLMSEIKPDEIYNLAAQSHVQVSFEVPNYTAQVDAMGTLTVLEAMRAHCPNAKFYQASTSELYGGMSYNKNDKGFYDENSGFHPRSPYGVAKLYGYWIVKNYRESYGLFACNGILFNHESERRGKTFITRKVTTNMVQVKNGTRDVLTIGNLDAERDWGHAKEYVEGMWRMLQQDSPEDFVLATGKTYKVRTFIEMAAKHLGWEIEWKGSGVDEKGYDKSTGKLLVEVDPKYFRPAEVDRLIGDPSKAKEKLGWEAKIDLEELVKLMINHDLKHEK